MGYNAQTEAYHNPDNLSTDRIGAVFDEEVTKKA